MRRWADRGRLVTVATKGSIEADNESQINSTQDKRMKWQPAVERTIGGGFVDPCHSRGADGRRASSYTLNRENNQS